MTVRKIIEIPDERLRVTYQKVECVSTVQTLIDDMLDTVYSTDHGIGLAAPQIGRTEAVAIIDISTTRDNPLILINPELVETDGEYIGEEGCLSVPGFYANVKRFKKIKVKALNREGEEFFVEDDGYLAIVMQHEIDHLHGKIFIDYLSPLKRQMAMKKIKKQKMINNK
ncbi:MULTISPECIES: peptide deformylase [Xenorhabdus]|uniref:Peptide deformylase n=1 Tax=Xenorhabdus hominickii TaxID=351679 RepID=A0A1V0M4F3_XENHO|nr:peptide deformylase [Xenorhabdus hominickii]ARD69746.1 Peptide deformylase 2 [Xenorhabdus hominickii]PHM51783.1 peptide deformylase [Xenorhabdus hominickii]